MTVQTSYSGSSREVEANTPGVLKFTIGDYWSAGDKGRSRQPISGMGRARHLCAVKSFALAKEAGVPTHFVRADNNSFYAEEFAVPNHDPLSGETAGEVLHAEWIWRLYLEGSLWDRVQSGEIDPVELGFEKGHQPQKGERLPRIRLEWTTKYEPIDRKIGKEEALDLMKLSEAEAEEAWNMIEVLANAVDQHARRCGFRSPDGKVEVGRRWRKVGQRLLIVDTFGTPDENRFIGLEDGLIYSKDIIREYLKEVGYMSELKKAQELHKDDPDRWPEYPILPSNVVVTTQSRYDTFAVRYAA